MASFTKLFSSIITSTVWMEGDQTRLVWITMLALADRNGEVQGSVPGLARIAAVPVEACRAALATFLAPDPDSRTKDDEGRRIEEIDGGWLLLNHAKYRKMASKEEQVEKATERTRRYRAKRDRNALSTPVHGNPTEAEAEAEAEADIAKSPSSSDSSTAKQIRVADKRGSALPKDWQPNKGDIEFAIDLGLDPVGTVDEFKDYWCDVPGAKGRKLDWSGTFRNRCRELGRRPRKASGVDKDKAIQEAIKRGLELIPQ